MALSIHSVKILSKKSLIKFFDDVIATINKTEVKIIVKFLCIGKIQCTITLKIADQRWFNIYVVFTKILCGGNFSVW